MESQSKKSEEKQPVLNSAFRMLVERIVSEFADTNQVTLEFPKTLQKEQRDFVYNYVYKFNGLRSKLVGSGPNVRVQVFKEEENLVGSANCTIDLKARSKKVVNKLLDLLDNSPSSVTDGAIDDLESKNLPIDLVRIGSSSRYGGNIITVPKNSVNTNCVANRRALPIFKHREELLEVINNNRVVIIESATGSGKSTQVPQFLLEEATRKNQKCRVIVAEPKRICATTLGNRVSYERGEKIGGTVGYQVRLEAKVAPTSNLIYVTNGVILRMLMSGQPEDFFKDITALIVDEVHERDAFTDFLLLCVREYLQLNPNLKIIIMSATMQSELFSEYFGGCPVFKIEGRTFPVEEFFLEDILRILDFKTPEIVQLYEDQRKNPEMFTKHVKAPDDGSNLDDDTKDSAYEILDKMIYSSDIDREEFYHFLYMVQADQVPVDFRHSKTNKTALMFAVEKGLKDQVVKLLNLKADPNLKVKIDNMELSAFDMAMELHQDDIVSVINDHLNKKKTPKCPSPDEMESSKFDRHLLDLYYDTLIQPGVNRGMFLDDVIDLNLIVTLVQHLHFNTRKELGILIFLPGHDEIIQLANLLCTALDMTYDIFILHSQMHVSHQKSVFDPMPEGMRKIIIATNIAESSITVNDVVFVIDSGKQKQKSFNPATHVSCLRIQWISKASAKQRAGRAGRVAEGTVFRMYSRDRFNYLVDSQKPELLRCDLTDICLQAKMIAKKGTTINDFLMKTISPPSESTIQFSILILQQLGALQYDETLTQLGRFLGDIPFNSKYAKMLIYGIFFRCIDPILTLVSILSINEPFLLQHRPEDRDRLTKIKHELGDGSYSDHFVMLKIFQKWNEYKTSNEFDGGFCEDNFVNPGTMERIASTRQKIVGYLRSVCLIQSVGNLSALNEYSNNWSVIKACIAAGSYPEVARILKKKGDIITPIDSKLLINPGSILRPKVNTMLKDHMSQFPSEWMFFEEKVLLGGYGMARVCTLASSLCIAFFTGLGLEINDDRWSDDGQIPDDLPVELVVDKFIKFSANETIAYILENIRQRIDTLLNRYLMNVDTFEFSDKDDILISGVVKLLELEDEETGFKIKHDGIGSRPRVITREYNNTRPQRTSADAEHKEKGKVQTPPPVEQKEMKDSSMKFKIKTPPKTNTMRYFMVELKSEVQLKSKFCYLLKAQAQLPDTVIDALIEMEVNDRVSKKVMIFYTGELIVGAGMLMDCREQQMSSDIMKMYFQSEQRFKIGELNSIATAQQMKNLLKKPFAEIPFEIGWQCVYNCSHELEAQEQTKDSLNTN